MHAFPNRKYTLEQRSNAGVTLVELMVALAIGSFLIIGAVQIATQSRHAFRVNESIAKVQETAQFVLDTLETDLRMASHWGMLSRGDAVDGRWLGAADPDPLDLLPDTGTIVECGIDWVLNLARPIEGLDEYDLPCDANAEGAQAQSDVLTIRRAGLAALAPGALVDGPLYIQSTRTQGRLFTGTAVPAGLASTGTESETHALMVSSYYVAADSELIPGVPTLRRKVLTVSGTTPTIRDEEVAPGIENLQVQFGVDVNQDGAVDRYADPGDTILDDPANRVLTARIWLVVRAVDAEVGIVDNTTYAPGNENLGNPDDAYRRLQVSKTILLRNART